MPFAAAVIRGAVQPVIKLGLEHWPSPTAAVVIGYTVSSAVLIFTAFVHPPIFVFIHGGAWLQGEAKNYAFPAELFVDAGAHYVALDFVAIKAANGDLRVMADQVRRGVAWVYKNAGSFGGDPNRLYVGGHSSQTVEHV